MIGVVRIKMLPKTTSIAEVQAFIDEVDAGTLTHNAFPVVDSLTNQRLSGLVEVSEMRHALENKAEEKKEAEAVPEGKAKQHALKKAGMVSLLNYADRSPVTGKLHTLHACMHWPTKAPACVTCVLLFSGSLWVYMLTGCMWWHDSLWPHEARPCV